MMFTIKRKLLTLLALVAIMKFYFVGAFYAEMYYESIDSDTPVVFSFVPAIFLVVTLGLMTYFLVNQRNKTAAALLQLDFLISIAVLAFRIISRGEFEFPTDLLNLVIITLYILCIVLIQAVKR